MFLYPNLVPKARVVREDPPAPKGQNQSGVQGGAPVVARRDVDDFTMSLVSRYGSHEAALRQIAGEQFNLRVRNRRLKSENERLTALVPADGTVVLKADDAKLFNEFKALNLTPAQIKATGEKALKLETDLADAAKFKVFDAAAGTLKYQAKALRKLVPENLTVEMRTVQTRNAKGELEPSEVPFIKDGTDDKAAFIELSAYLKREVGDDLLGAIKVKDENAGKGGRTTTSGQERGGAKVLPQRSASSSSATDKQSQTATQVVDRHIASRYMTPGQRASQATTKASE